MSARGLHSSIWAPQPHSPTGSWPHASRSLSQSTFNIDNNKPINSILIDDAPPATKEDVFGLVESENTSYSSFGDTRQQFFPPSDNDHVEQLLRSLNLNSPGPQNQSSSFGVEFEVSPTTSTSIPTTPLDNSPVALRSPHEMHFQINLDSSTSNEQGQGHISISNNVPHAPHNKNAGWTDASYSPFRTSYAHVQPVYSPSYSPFTSFDSAPEQSPTSLAKQLIAEYGRNNIYRWRAQDEHPAFDGVNRFSGTANDSESPSLFDIDSSRVQINDQSMFQVDISSFTPQLQAQMHEPINFLSLLHPSSSPPYTLFVTRVVKSSDQQASIFLQQKLKAADSKERAKIVDAICTRGYEMMAHRFGNWAVQRCLEAASTPEERRKIANCMRGRVVDLSTNCYGCHVLQKALDCEEDIRLLIVKELLVGDPAQTLVNKHASHVWSKVMELTWTPPAPPIFAYVNQALKGKWSSLACHETGSLVVQHAFENLEQTAKDGIVDELLKQGSKTFGEVAKNQWGSYCIQHIIEHGSPHHRELAISHLLHGLLEYATNEQGYKSVTKTLKEGGKDVMDRFVQRLCEPPPGGRRAIIIDIALSNTGSQMIASVLPNVSPEQRSRLYDSIRGHIVTLRGCKTGSKVIWLFDRMV